MIDRDERLALVRSLATYVRKCIGAALTDIGRRFDEADARIRAIPPGPKGDKGDKGEPGEMGLSITGDPGAAGKDGKDGRDGRDGRPGQDALELVVLPKVEPGKCYPRGAWAKHAGGVIRALRDTDPIDGDLAAAGWEVMLDGLAEVTIAQEADPRRLSIVCRKTSGVAMATAFSIPWMLYREIYRDGATYAKGDVVTWGGSAWHCQVAQTRAKPGADSRDWKLMVKEGRPGKDGKDGKDGERGPEGPRGRDLTQMAFDGTKH
jgi:hypothetical protein